MQAVDQSVSAGEQMRDPGFYADDDGRLKRYWDGRAWAQGSDTFNRVPVDIRAGFVLAAVLPVFGFFMGLMYLHKEIRHGLHMVVLAAIALVVWSLLIAAGLGAFESDPSF